MAQLQFKGKTFVQNHHLLVKYHELVPVKAKSLTDKVSLHDNLIIHGDNLKALKALLPLYAGKVKCVYIDPPYNTGNEGWAYNDNVSSPMMQDWLGKVVDREDLTRHDKWLCMMMPRLKLIKELLREDGGNRRFILIECENYADSITAERVRRVIKGIPSAKDETLKKGLGWTFSFFKLGKPLELESILDGDSLPTYEELARYVFYTATGEEFDEKAVDAKKNIVGESRNYQVFLFYEPDVTKLKNLAFTLDMAKALPPLKPDKRRLVFAPTKYLDQEHLDRYRIDFAQLPFEIYELTR